MITLQTAKNLIRKTLSATDYEQTEIFAIEKRLLEDILKLPTSLLFTLDKDTILTNDEETKIYNCLSKLSINMPLQYILQKTYFHRHTLHIEQGALIPRSETEELCEMVISSLKGNTKAIKIIDACTGSGCIAYSLAYSLDDRSEIFAVDISDKALEIAEINFLSLPKGKAKVHCIKTDILNMDTQLPECDIIVSNPPYIMTEEKKDMSATVTDFEPHIALFAPDEDHTAFYTALGKMIKNGCLKKGGSMWVEINPMLYRETAEAISISSGIDARHIKVIDDMSGKKRFIHLINL